jgi:hypothetical protein
MSKLEELHFATILEADYDPEDKVPNYVGFASKSAQLTRDLMIEFAEFCRDKASREGTYGGGFTGNWELHVEQKIVTTEQLLEIFLKQRYGNQD